jgi:outer membrane receptor protein involved in Fe transport
MIVFPRQARVPSAVLFTGLLISAALGQIPSTTSPMAARGPANAPGTQPPVPANDSAVPRPPAVAATRAPEAPPEQDVVQLSPFEVAEEAGSGYATTSSVTFSRIATRNTELPISAIVINEKLIEDTLAVSFEDTLNLIGGAYHGNAGTGNQENNDFSLRGYTNSGAQRDGVDDSLFTSVGGFDYSFVDRIEIARGPNGILYGTHNPGGVVNIVSKRPRAKPFTKVSAMIGSFDFYRAELDTSQFLDKSRRLGIRIAGAVSNTRGPVDWPADPRKGYRGINPSVLYRTKFGLEMWVWTSFVRDNSGSRAKYSTRAFPTSPYTGTIGPTGAPLIDRAFIDGGGGQGLLTSYSEVDTDTYELGASKSVKFGPVRLDGRVIGRYRKQFSDGSRVRAIAGSEVFTDSQGNRLSTQIDNRRIELSLVDSGRLGGVYRNQIRYDERPGDRGDHNYGLDLNLTYNVGAVRFQTLLNGTYTVGHRTALDNVYDITNNSVLQSLGYQIVNGLAQIWEYPVSKVKFGLSGDTVKANATTKTVRGGSITQSEAYGYGIVERMYLLNSRVILVGGARQNHVESLNGRAGGVLTPQEGDKLTPGGAGLVKVYKHESDEAIIYVNGNKTFTPVFTIDQRLATFGQKFPDRVASTKEIGVKLDLLRSRVVATASYFDNTENNYLLTLVDTDGSVTGIKDRTYSAPVGVRTNRGYELDLNFKVFGSLESVLSYGKINPKLADGTIPEAIPYDTASALIGYRFRKGWAKGASTSYIYNHWGRSRLGGSRTTWEMPGGNLHTAIIGYRWKNTDIRLRLENLFDVRDPQAGSFDTAVGITKPRNYRFGVTTVF